MSSRLTATAAREAPEVLNDPVDVRDAAGQYVTKLTQRALWPDMVSLYANGAVIEHYEWLTNSEGWLKGAVFLGDFYSTDSSRHPDSLYVRMTDATNFQQRHLSVDTPSNTAFVVWDVLPDVYSSVSMTLLYDSNWKIIKQTAVMRGIASQATKSVMMV